MRTIKAIGVLSAISILFVAPLLAQTNQPTSTEKGAEQQYTVVPLQGSVQATRKNVLVGQAVKDKNGQPAGTLNHIIIDSASGNIVAGVIKMDLREGAKVLGQTVGANRSALKPIAWRNFQIDPKTSEVSLKLGLDEVVSASVVPYLDNLVKDIE